MKFTSQQYAQALFDSISETAPKDHDKVLDNFVKVLAANGDLGKHAEIEAAYHRIEMESKGIKEVNVTVAREMEVNKRIIEEINAVVQARGLPNQKKQAEGLHYTTDVKTKVDESIIGGVVIRVDDTLIDASVRTQLNNLNNTLKT